MRAARILGLHLAAAALGLAVYGLLRVLAPAFDRLHGEEDLLMDLPWSRVALLMATAGWLAAVMLRKRLRGAQGGRRLLAAALLGSLGGTVFGALLSVWSLVEPDRLTRGWMESGAGEAWRLAWEFAVGTLNMAALGAIGACVVAYLVLPASWLAVGLLGRIEGRAADQGPAAGTT